MKHPQGTFFKKYGLKFHISLPEGDIENISKGWDVIKSFLMEHEVNGFKICIPEVKMSYQKGQAGKTITIFAYKNPEKSLAQWQVVLQLITEKLVEANIPPGYRAVGTTLKPEKPVNGSNYLTYRYENEINAKKNCWPTIDPCEQGFESTAPLVIKVANQPPIPLQQSDIIMNPSTSIAMKKY